MISNGRGLLEMVIEMNSVRGRNEMGRGLNEIKIEFSVMKRNCAWLIENAH